jgi:hypothetical protein
MEDSYNVRKVGKIKYYIAKSEKLYTMCTDSLCEGGENK